MHMENETKVGKFNRVYCCHFKFSGGFWEIRVCPVGMRKSKWAAQTQEVWSNWQAIAIVAKNRSLVKRCKNTFVEMVSMTHGAHNGISPSRKYVDFGINMDLYAEFDTRADDNIDL